MVFSRDTIGFRYIFDIATGMLHDLRSVKNPDNKGCGLETAENWVAFDTDREPVKGAIIKKLTATKEVVDIEVKSLCPHCMTPEDENLMGLLKDYFLTQEP
jgi:hypothetical protein